MLFQSVKKPNFWQTGRGKRSIKGKQLVLVGVYRYGRGRVAPQVKTPYVARTF